MSDLYNSKYVFLTGAAAIAGFSLGAGFAKAQVPLFILRAFMGVGAALTVPSALYLIIHMFPDPAEQSKAVAMFGGCGALGNVIGLLIGAFIVQWGTWPWLFYVFAMMGAVVFAVIAILLPSPHHFSALSNTERFKRLDLFGVFFVTGGLVLFIFGVTAGSVNGWGSARCLTPLIVSLFLLVGFFVWEAQLPEDIAAIPTSLWQVKNFTVLVVGSATMPYMWFGVVQLLFSWIWQNVYGWSPINTAVHFLPIGLLASAMSFVAGPLQRNFPLKWVLCSAQSLALIGTIFLTFGDSPQHYWPFIFPGLIIGTAGIATAYMVVNIAVFAVTPPEKAGVVGSIFNCFQQVGCAAGSAIITSIQTSVDLTHGGPSVFTGRRAGIWFQFGLLAISTICVALFMRSDVSATKKSVQGTENDLEIPEKANDLAIPAEKSGIDIHDDVV
ncbi:hypothetical protein AGABI2DRAFT_229854 [Agaricus bisporus var. bisporus H97]|uniref:hypothetical protein n=1 Tax=Agaricus bisporus var. bisporus (strain H97 / ATCC MYA-4626 / FGSC 10389) TaxID=936046 RepID=UPI00029F7CED|nr:hypothetical protein AGABI2DRAFT_229854 [Agaricus bisporus var. bisporus H97]EKV41822.1 hypothetical protein AGABI2DRAFT_229854 [Agaricus bisporus var. bisporus H97]